MTILAHNYQRGKAPSKHNPDFASNWFIFGEYDDGNVDVSDSNRDIVTHCPREVANKLIKARDSFLAEICLIVTDEEGSQS